MNKLESNRINAQASTGPVTEEGKRTSSRNAVKHGFTGKELYLTDEERDLYQTHVEDYLRHHAPADYQQKQLVFQLADIDWSIQQINVEQQATINLMSAIRKQLATEDPLYAADKMAKINRQLNTLNLYEQRRRRAAKSVLADLAALKEAAELERQRQLHKAAQAHKAAKQNNLPFDPAQFGFVCSPEEIERQAAIAEHNAQLDQALAMMQTFCATRGNDLTAMEEETKRIEAEFRKNLK